MTHVKMKELPRDIQPYERCLKEGPSCLSDAQLLSIIIRTGSRNANSLELAQEILALNYPKEGILGLLHLSLAQLMSIKGIGQVKGIQLLCIGELSKRIWNRRITQQPLRLDAPELVAQYCQENMRHLEQEEFRVLMFNTKQILTGDVMISRGTVNASLATPREVLIEALRFQAVSLILVHNHPSGDPEPSSEDIRLTQRMREAAELIGIRLLDHIIIGDSAYISLKERGFL